MLLLDYDVCPQKAVSLSEIAMPRSYIHSNFTVEHVVERISNPFITMIQLTDDPATVHVHYGALSTSGDALLAKTGIALFELDASAYNSENSFLIEQAREPGFAKRVPLFQACENDKFEVVMSTLAGAGSPRSSSEDGHPSGILIMRQWIGSLALSRALSTKWIYDFVLVQCPHWNLPEQSNLAPLPERAFQPQSIYADPRRNKVVDFWAWYPAPVPPDLPEWLNYLSRRVFSEKDLESLGLLWPTIEGFYKFTFGAGLFPAMEQTLDLPDPSKKINVLFSDVWHMEAEAYMLVRNQRARIAMNVLVSVRSSEKEYSPFTDWRIGGTNEQILLFVIPDIPRLPEAGPVRSTPSLSPATSSTEAVRNAYRRNRRRNTALHQLLFADADENARSLISLVNAPTRSTPNENA